MMFASKFVFSSVFKLLSSLIIVCAFLNGVPINRTFRPEQIIENELNSTITNPFISKDMVLIISCMPCMGLSVMVLGGTCLLSQDLFSSGILDNLSYCISSIVLTNKEFGRMKSKIENTKERSIRNRDKLKNENKKVQRREKKIQSIQAELNKKDKKLKTVSDEYLITKKTLEKKILDQKKQIESLLAQKEKISLQKEEVTLQKDLAHSKINLTRELLTANSNSKSNRFNVYSLFFTAKIVCTFILSFGTFRGLSRTLRSLREVELFKFSSLPCANSIINWSMRAGLGKLNSVGKVNDEFVIIIDHWIGKGSQKIFAALRLLKSEYDSLIKEKRAVSLRELELVKLKVMESANAQTNYQCLKEMFEKIGHPLGIICDEGPDLVSGIKLYNTLEDMEIERIPDIGHFSANALKRKYSKEDWFKDFLNESSAGSNKIKQTKLAKFQSPTLRVKARFMNLSSHAHWAIRIIDTVKGPTKSDDEVKKRLGEIFGITITHRESIREFASVIRIVNLIHRIIKTRGLNENSFKLSRKILQKLPENHSIRTELCGWLDTQMKLLNRLEKRGWSKSLPASSDSIESFFFQA